MTITHSRLRTQVFLGALCILAAGFWAYHNSFGGAFVFDDVDRILKNSHIRHLWPIWDILSTTSRPLVELSLAINCALGGTQVFGYHVVNLLIHLSAALVLFGIVRRTFRTESLRARYEESATGLALAIALLWVVHPLQTESVTYLIQRAESLMGLFYLLTLYCFIRGVTSERRRGWYVMAVIACAAGMSTKPIMVTAPLLVLLYDRTFISGTFLKALSQRKRLYLGMTMTWGLLAALLALTPPDTGAGFTVNLSPLIYICTQPSVLLHYLKLSFWPGSLCLDYAWPEARELKQILIPMLVIGPLGLLTLWALQTKRSIGFLGAWFFLILAPTSSFIPIKDFIFEHRMYLSLAAVIGLVVTGSYEFLRLMIPSQQKMRQATAIGLVAISVVLLSLMTIHRNEDYRSEETIWRDTISKSPKNTGAQINLSLALDQQGYVEEAKTHLIQALQLDSNSALAHENLGALLLKQGYLEEAKDHLIRVLQLGSGSAEVYNNLGVALFKQGHLEEARTYFTQALKLDSNHASADTNLGFLFLKQGHLEEARAYFIQALQLEPNSAESHNGLAIVDHLMKTSQLNP